MEGYEFLNIQENCYVGSTIFKKLFYENGNLLAADKEIFTEVVNKITWVYSLKPETINVKPFKDEVRDYPEIEVLEVQVSKEIRIKRIAEIIMRNIPYPMVLIFRLNEKVQIWASHEKINLNDNSQNTIEEFINTSWLEPGNVLFKNLNIKNMRFTNYFTMYSDIIDAISIYNAWVILKDSNKLTGEKAREILNQAEQLDKEIETLRAAIKKETQFNRKVELNIKIKRLEETKEILLKGDNLNE